jgi:hypothetical protein
MFYCDSCRKKHDYPISMSRSYGVCELCGRTAPCNDVPSSHLPKSKKRGKGKKKGGK